MNTSTRVIEKLALFSGMLESACGEFFLAARQRRFIKGEAIFLHADLATSFFILISGAVRVHRQTSQGAEVTLHIAGPGDMLGEHELLESRKHYQASAVAIKDSLILAYSHRWMKSKMQEYPKFTMNMLTAVSRSASRAIIDKELLSTANAPQRVGCLLIQICDQYLMDPKCFTLPYSKVILASRLGMSPESFSRALVALRDIGVSVKGRKIHIANMGALEAYACGACSISWDCETCVRLRHRHAYKRRVKP